MNVLGMAAMLLVFLAVLLGGHFFVYFSLVRFLGIEAANAKLWLASILFLLSISFIASSIAAHVSENAFTKLSYFLSGLWLAIGWNLLMALVLSWAAIGVADLVGWNFNHRYLAIGSVVFAIVLSAYGIWSAYNPRIKNITVDMENLPEKWKGKKVVQLSDVHLGHVYGKDFLAMVVDEVNAQDPDAVFITGDLFDGMDGQLDSLVSPLNDIKAPEGTYFVTGNHETYLGVAGSLAVLQKTSVKVLDDQAVDIDGMQILGISYPERGEKFNLLEAIKKVKEFDPSRPSILLYHNPAEAMQAKEAGVDLQLAGHTHKGQLFPLQLITRLVYGKYYYGLFQEGDFSIYTSNGVGTWGPTMRTSGRPEIVVIRFK